MAQRLGEDRWRHTTLTPHTAPVMNGFEFLTENARDPALAQLPVVVLSADEAAIRRAEREGVAAAFTKPVDHGRLLEVIRNHC